MGESPLFFCCEASASEAAIMALNIEQIRRTADRVAASHGLDVVDIEYLGGSKHRVLRIFIEQNAEQRASRAQLASEQSLLEHLGTGGIALDQLAWVTHEDCERFSRDFGTVIDVEELVPVDDYTLEVSSPGLDRKLATRGRLRALPGKSGEGADLYSGCGQPPLAGQARRGEAGRNCARPHGKKAQREQEGAGSVADSRDCLYQHRKGQSGPRNLVNR